MANKNKAKVELTATQNIRIQNKEHLKERNKKYKVYALFQFFSTTTIFLLSIALGLVVYLGVKSHAVIDKAFFKEEFKSILSFGSKDSLNIFTALLTYFAFMMWFFSMGIALLQTKNKQRSMFDTAFLLFFFVPFLSNIIALLSSISETVYRTPSTHVDRYKTKIEYLAELERYISEEKKMINRAKQVAKKTGK